MTREDALEQLRRENPVTGPVRTVSLETLLLRIEDEPRATTRGTATSMRRWRERGGRAILPAVASVVAIGIGIFALTTLQHRRAPSRTTSTPSVSQALAGVPPRPPNPGPIPHNVDDAVIASSWNTAWSEDRTCDPATRRPVGRVTDATPSAKMLATIAALRRPATSVDRLPPFFLRRGPGGGADVYVRYVRRARVVDGATFYFVPAILRGSAPLPQTVANHCYQLTAAALRTKLPDVPAAERAATRRYGDAVFAVGRYNLEAPNPRQEGVGLLTERVHGGGGGVPQPLSQIPQIGLLSGGGDPSQESSIEMDGIVPTGVATVTLTFPASQGLPALSATGRVINNVFVIPVPTLFERGAWPATAIWRAESGNVIKVINERPFAH